MVTEHETSESNTNSTVYDGSSPLSGAGAARKKRTDSFLTLTRALRVFVGSLVCGAEYGN
jgi:hypothetical protein